MRWAGLVVHTGERRVADWVWLGNPEGRGHVEDLGVELRTILKWIFKKWVRGMDWIDLA